jgi:hypothetical protein
MVLVELLLVIGFVTLNLVAIYKIITKAGYSGKWIVVVVAPFIAELIGFAVFADDVHSRHFQAGNFAPWFALAGLLAFIEYILFLLFAFSNWPALRPRSYGYPSGYGYGYGRPGFPPSFGAGPGTRPPGTQSWRASSQPSAGPAAPHGWAPTQLDGSSRHWDQSRRVG